MPVVPCAQATIVQPPAGGVPGGVTTMPDTTIGLSSRPVDMYSTRVTAAPFESGASGSLRMTVPGCALGSGLGGV